MQSKGSGRQVKRDKGYILSETRSVVEGDSRDGFKEGPVMGSV